MISMEATQKESQDKASNHASRLRSSAPIVLLLVVLISSFGGCSSWPLPPSLSRNQATQIKSFHIRGSVGVIVGEHYPKPLADMALRQLQATNLFHKIDWVSALPSTPEYQLTLRFHSWCSNTFPSLWTIISLGIIPDKEGACSGYVFTIAQAANPDNQVDINSTYKGTAWHGWFAILINLLPDRTFGWDLPEKRDHSRFIDYLAWAIASKQSEIQGLSATTIGSGRSTSEK